MRLAVASLLFGGLLLAQPDRQTLLQRGATPFDITAAAEITVADDFDNQRATFELTLPDPANPGRRLTIAAPADLFHNARCGTRVRVAGLRLGDLALATDLTPLDIPDQPECSSTGLQRVAVLLVYRQGTSRPPMNPADVDRMMFGADDYSVASFYRDNSHNRLQMEGRVFGWYPIDIAPGCNKSGIEQRAIAAALADSDLRGYNRMVVLAHRASLRGDCVWEGISSIGCPTVNAGGFLFRASSTVTWIDSQLAAHTKGVVAHELGHGLGLLHARSYAFAGETLGFDPAAGYGREYGDMASAMGNGGGHFAAPHKLLLDWYTPDSFQDVYEDGEYTLLPLNARQDGTKALRLPRRRGGPAHLWLEYRPENGEINMRGSPPAKNSLWGLFLNSELPGRLLNSHQLDAHPPAIERVFLRGASPFIYPSFKNGETWRDPYGTLTLEVVELTPQAARVRITWPPPCVDPATVEGGPPHPEGGEWSLLVTPAPDCDWRATAHQPTLTVPALYYEAPEHRMWVTMFAETNTGEFSRPAPLTLGGAVLPFRQRTLAGEDRLFDIDATGNVLRAGSFASVGLLLARGYSAASFHEVRFAFGGSPEDSPCAFRYLATQDALVPLHDPDAAPSPISAGLDLPGCAISRFFAIAGRRDPSPGAPLSRARFRVQMVLHPDTPPGPLPLHVQFVPIIGAPEPWITAHDLSIAGPDTCAPAISASQLYVAAEGGRHTIALLSLAPCDAQPQADATWLSVVPGYVPGDQTFTLEAGPNDQPAVRETIVRLGESTLTVRQVPAGVLEAPHLFPDRLQLGPAAGRYLIWVGAFDRDLPAAAATVPWIHILDFSETPPSPYSAYSPTDDATMQVATHGYLLLDVEENAGEWDRQGSVRIGGATLQVAQLPRPR